MMKIAQRNRQHPAQKQYFVALQIAVHRQRAILNLRLHQRIFDVDGLMLIAKQNAARIQRLAVLLPLQNGLYNLLPARAGLVVIGRLVDFRAQRQTRFHGLVLERFHGIGQMRAMAVSHRQRKRRAVRKTGRNSILQKGVVGAQVRIDHLVFIPHAHKVGLVNIQQGFDDAERGFVDVVQLVADDKLVCGQRLVQFRRRAQRAGQVIRGIEKAARLDISEQVDALFFILDGPQIIGQRHGKAFRRQFRVHAVATTHERQGGFQLEQIVQKLADRRVVRADIQHIGPVGIVGADVFQGIQREGLLLANRRQRARHGIFHPGQHLPRKFLHRLHANPPGRVVGDAHGRQAGLQDLPGFVGERQRQDLFRCGSLADGFADAQRQRRGLGRTRVGQDQIDAMAGRLDLSLFVGRNKTCGDELNGDR